MVPMSHMMVPTSHVMLPTITLFGILKFYLLFKFNIYIYIYIYIKHIVPTLYWIILTSHMMVLISHLMVPIGWVPYSQKECGYYRMTQFNRST